MRRPRLTGAARRCATGLRPARDPGPPHPETGSSRGQGRHDPVADAHRPPDPCTPPSRGTTHALSTWLTPPRGTDKQGSVWVRWVLCEAAQTAKRNPQFAATYQAIAKRRGKKIATTAIARKLLTRAYHLLTDASSGSEPTS